MCKIKDIDSLFEGYVRVYMKKNAGKFTEEEWEAKIPELYSVFGTTAFAELDGKTPETYYDGMTGEELTTALTGHVQTKVPVSDYLCEALTSADDAEDALIALLDADEEELVMYALNILGDRSGVKALPRFVEFIIGDAPEHVKDLAAELLCDKPEEIKETLLRLYNGCSDREKDYFAEILSRCAPDDRIFDILIDGFESTGDLPLYAVYLARFGDDRALPVLLSAIEREDINYQDFQELKFAIEKLGGDYDKPRDFSGDKLYKKIKGAKS